MTPDELKALAEAATPGEWTWGAEFVCAKVADVAITGWPYVEVARCTAGQYDSPKWRANAAYISAVGPKPILALIARVERVEAALRLLERCSRTIIGGLAPGQSINGDAAHTNSLEAATEEAARTLAALEPS